MTWPLVKLGECCEIVSGATPKTGTPEHWGGGIPWATPKDLSALDGKHIDRTAQTISQAGEKSCSTNLLPAGSVLFSSRAPIGHVAINTVPMCTNQGFKSLVPSKDKVSADYLYHWLRTNKAYLQSLGNGATFKEVSKPIVARVEIPLPPLEEQKRIAAILDKADELREKRRQAIAKLDQLLQSVFLDMFGDPVTNPKGWPIFQLNDIAQVSTGGTPPGVTDIRRGEWTPFVTPGDLFRIISDTKRGLYKAPEKTRLVRAGSTLVCCIGATIGKMGMASSHSAFNQQINAVEWNKRVDDYFGFFALSFFKAQIANGGTSTTLPILKKSSFERISIPVPSIHEQKRFARFVQKAWDTNGQLASTSETMDNLSKGLQTSLFQ